MNAFMPPPPTGPVNDTGGSFPQNKPVMTDSPQTPQFGPTFNFHFNPGGGIGSPGSSPTPRPFSGPIQFTPPDLGHPANTPGPLLPGTRGMPGFAMMRPQPMPGWAGYLNWLQSMGGRPTLAPGSNPGTVGRIPGYMPPPQIQGI